MSLDKIQEFARKSAEILSNQGLNDRAINEAQLVHEFIAALDYDVDAEPSISPGVRPDLIVHITEEHSLVIEFKRPNRELDSEAVNQIEKYIDSEPEIDWGVITNGREYRIYKKIIGPNESQVIQIESIDVEAMAQNPDSVEFLQRGQLTELHTLSSGLLTQDDDTLNTWGTQLAGSLGPVLQAAEFHQRMEGYQGSTDELHDFLLDHSYLHPNSYRGYVNNILGTADNISAATSDSQSRAFIREVGKSPTLRRSPQSLPGPNFFTTSNLDIEFSDCSPTMTHSLNEQEQSITRAIGLNQQILRYSIDTYEDYLYSNNLYSDGGRFQRTDIIGAAGQAAMGLTLLTFGSQNGDPIVSYTGTGLVFSALSDFPEELIHELREDS